MSAEDFSDRSPQGGMGILGMGNSRAKTYTAGDTGVTFDDVAGAFAASGVAGFAATAVS